MMIKLRNNLSNSLSCLIFGLKAHFPISLFIYWTFLFHYIFSFMSNLICFRTYACWQMSGIVALLNSLPWISNSIKVIQLHWISSEKIITIREFVKTWYQNVSKSHDWVFHFVISRINIYALAFNLNKLT